MLGHNIVADRWAGASNPQPRPNHTPNPPPTHSHTQYQLHCNSINARFWHFQLQPDGGTDKRMDEPMQWTNGRTKPLIELRVRN